MANWARWHRQKRDAIRACEKFSDPGSTVWEFDAPRQVYFLHGCLKRSRSGFFIMNGSSAEKDLPDLFARAKAEVRCIHTKVGKVKKAKTEQKAKEA